MSAEPCSPTAQHFRLREALRTGAFAVTAEIAPPRGADLGAVREAAAVLRGWVHAANVTDNQGAQVRVSSLAGSVAALAAGLEPVMQMTTRDRNRIALQSDLLAAGALGVPNLLLMTGDRPERGDHADATAVYDLSSGGLMRAARALRDDGVLLSGRAGRPAAALPARRRGHRGRRARTGWRRKVDDGAEFVQTQFVFDVAAFAGLAGPGARPSGWTARCADPGRRRAGPVAAGVGVPGRASPAWSSRRRWSGGCAGYRRTGWPRRAWRPARRRWPRCDELPGLAGVHVMSVGYERGVPEILSAAGLSPLAP